MRGGVEYRGGASAAGLLERLEGALEKARRPRWSSPVFLSLFPTIAEMDCSFHTVVQKAPLRQGVLPHVCGLSGID